MSDDRMARGLHGPKPWEPGQMSAPASFRVAGLGLRTLSFTSQLETQVVQLSNPQFLFPVIGAKIGSKFEPVNNDFLSNK